MSHQTDPKFDVIAVAAREALSLAEDDTDMAAAIMTSAATTDPVLKDALLRELLPYACKLAVLASAGPRVGG